MRLLHVSQPQQSGNLSSQWTHLEIAYFKRNQSLGLALDLKLQKKFARQSPAILPWLPMSCPRSGTAFQDLKPHPLWGLQNLFQKNGLKLYLDNLKTHAQYVHEGKKPLKCKYCGEIPSLKYDFKTHLTLFIKERAFHSTSVRKHLINHLKSDYFLNHLYT